MPPRTWAILRPSDEAAALVDALRARGVDARACPAIERAPLQWPHEARSPAHIELVLLTSAYAAQLTAQHMPGARVGATAPATADAARALGLDVVFEVQGGAAELGEACARWLERLGADAARAVVRYPTSDAGEAQPEQQTLVERVSPRARLVRFPAYTTRPAARLAADLAALPSGLLAVVAASPSAVRALAVLRPSVGFALCVGRSTERAWHEAFPDVPVRLAPRELSLVDVIQSIEQERA